MTNNINDLLNNIVYSAYILSDATERAASGVEYDYNNHPCQLINAENSFQESIVKLREAIKMIGHDACNDAEKELLKSGFILGVSGVNVVRQKLNEMTK
jgi:hypothetical protein